MFKDQAKNELILPNLKQGEELIGFFTAIYSPAFIWFFLFGPLYYFGNRSYWVAVTDVGLHLHKLTFWGKPDTYEFTSYAEISSLKLGKGLLQAPLKLKFSNGKKLALKAILKGLERAGKLDDQTKEFLLSKYK